MLTKHYKSPPVFTPSAWLLVALLSLPALLLPLGASAQDGAIQVSGTVSDAETGDPLPGVNVLIKGTTVGTATDAGGRYALSVPANDAVLIFSFIGYSQKEVLVGANTQLNVQLTADIASLDEVVVVGYGVQERAKVTSAISSISSDEIRALPVNNLAAAMQGRAAGVIVTNTGSPGTNPIVRIRGIGTVGNNDPLYVIDGVPAGGLNQINSADIESIEVLKDASAAAIYGSRASNGVILVTTKKGKIGRPVIAFDSYYGIQKAWRQLDLLNREQYLDYGTDLLTNGGLPLPDRFSNMGELDNVDTDWQDEMFQSAPIQDHNISISGGTEKAIYNISTGYFKQEGIMLGTDFERVSFRANTEFKIHEKVTIGQTLTLAYSNRANEPFTGGRSQLEHTVKQVPYIPVRDASRLGGFRAPDAADGSDPENPVLNAVLRENTQEDFKILGTGYVDIDIYKGLRYKFLVGIDMNYGVGNQYSPRFRAGDFNFAAQANINKSSSNFFSPLLSSQLSYSKTFAKHNLSAVGVIEQQTSTFNSLNGAGENALTNEIRELQGIQNPSTSSNRSVFALISYIGRVTYDYDQKYLFNASFRRDGGSRFGPSNKWGNFPSVSVGWRISQEDFMSSVSAISDLKLRASYGEVGNLNSAGDYAYQGTINSNFFYNFDGNLQGGSTINRLANENLRWENTIMKNIGLDLGLFADRLNFSFEWFDNRTEGMILARPIQPSLGYDQAPIDNIGTVSNNGIEMVLGYKNYDGDFQWSVDGNISFVNNELVSLGAANTIFGPEFQGDPLTFTEEGQPIAYFYGWVADGLFQEGDDFTTQPGAQPGDIRFRDLNGDQTINSNDRTNIGHFLPDFSFGLNFSATYKNFDFAVFFQGVSGNEIYNNLRYHTEGMTRLFNASTVVLDRWTPENTNTDVPRAVSGDPNENARASSRWIEDGSYLRLKNLSIGYTLPASVLGGFGNGAISKLRFYVSSQNLFTITDYTGYDPEIGVRTGLNASLSTGIDYGQFPAARTVLGGVQVTF